MKQKIQIPESSSNYEFREQRVELSKVMSHFMEVNDVITRYKCELIALYTFLLNNNEKETKNGNIISAIFIFQ